MATKIRLQRHGKKGKPFYHIVIADSRAKRDGRFIEKVGTYNPDTKPAEININFDSCLNWLQKGAIPTDTARAILSHKGVLLKKHLLDGVKKGALTEEKAEEKFSQWIQEKESKLANYVKQLNEANTKLEKEKFEIEEKARKKKEEEILAKQKAAAEEKTEDTPAEEKTEDAPAEEKTEDTPAEEKTEDTPTDK